MPASFIPLVHTTNYPISVWEGHSLIMQECGRQEGTTDSAGVCVCNDFPALCCYIYSGLF